MAEAGSVAERLAWVRRFELTGDTAGICREFAITRVTLRKWWTRYLAAGEAGLDDASRTPRRSPARKIFAAEASWIEALRREGLSFARIKDRLLVDHGLDISVPTIRKALQRAAPSVPAARAVPRGMRPPSLFAASLPNDDISRRLAGDITRGLLHPGERLTEEALSLRYRVGRTRIREALRAVAMIGLVGIERNRGAIVATPSPREVADAYAARAVIEQQIVRDVAREHTAEQMAQLQQHLERQVLAERSGDKVELVHLLTEFHILLASFSRNQFLRGFVETLATTTSLAVLLHDQSSNPSCAVEEHRLLLHCIATHDGDRASSLMAHHLGHNHTRLAFSPAGGS
jgi:DNA-binding GntR family transcriptional regulator/transposase-like protein